MVSVDAAIKKGQIQLVWIPLSIMFACPIIALIAISFINDGSIWIPIVGFGGFLLAITLPFAYYGLMLARWRIWAFSNVRNVHELKHRATIQRLCPPDGSFLWRLERKSAAQKDALKNLEQKFNLPDVFEDDYSIAYQTSYAYSKSDKIILSFISALSFALAITMFDASQTDQMLLSAFLLVCSVVMGVVAYKRFKTTAPLLTISNEGITTLKNGFHPWRDIKNEQVFFVSAGQASYYGLSYEAYGETIKMSLKDLTGLRSYKVDHVLRTYRGRYQRQYGVKPSFAV
jgi:hypothetical protein